MKSIVVQLDSITELGISTYGSFRGKKFEIFRHEGEIYLTPFMIKMGLRFATYCNTVYRTYKNNLK